LFTILRGCAGFERTEQPTRDLGDFIDRAEERFFVGFGRRMKTADFSNELKGSSSNLVGSDRRTEVEKSFDIPAHCMTSSSDRPAFMETIEVLLLRYLKPIAMPGKRA
jgi:hypothetical protein